MRRRRMFRALGRAAALAIVAGAAVVLVSACGSSTSGAGSGPTQSGSGHGNVNVLYAGSLQNLIENRVAPAFQRATGYGFSGYPAGSSELASEIKGKIRQGDVFISASPTVNARLSGAANGNWVSWYAPFASTELVLGYNPHSSFAAQLKTKPWYRVITEPGFRLGFTDPKLDPKGVLTVSALKAAAVRYHDPALLRLTRAQGDLFPEQDLVGRLQSGQLDAGFFYTVEAAAAKIPTVSLGAIKERSVYTITVLNRAAHATGAAAFIRFLLGSRGRALLRSAGLSVQLHPTATGHGFPAALSGVIQSG